MSEIVELLDRYNDTAVTFGESCITQFENLIYQLAPQKIVAFTGSKSVDKNNAWGSVLTACGVVDAIVLRYSAIEPEPSIETVEKMIDFLRKEKPDEVLAIGGGSIMDAAKAAYLVYQAGGTIHDYFGVNKFEEKYPGAKIKKVICFPTTAGTGSEVTPYSNIVDNKADVKKLIVENSIIPEYSFVNPTFAMSMNTETTRATACDALAHLIEGFLNTARDKSHPAANKWALKGIELIVKYLPVVLSRPDNVKAREALSAASCMGGMVIRYKPTGLPHLCSFSWFGKIPHGLAVAILLPYAWNYYLTEASVRARTMELKDIFKNGGSTPESIVEAYCKFLKSLGVPLALCEIESLDMALMDKTAKLAGENRMKLASAPRPVPIEKSYEVLSEILLNAWNGKYS